MELLLLYRILKRRLRIFIFVFLVFLMSTIIGTELLTRQYLSQSTVMISESASIASMLASLDISGSDWYSGRTVFEGVDVALATSRSLVEHVIQEAELKDSAGEYLEYEDITDGKLTAFVKGYPFLEAELEEDTDRILIISAYAPSREKAREMCRIATDEFVAGRLERIKQEFAVAQAHLKASVEQSELRYRQALALRRDYQQANASVDLDMETELVMEQIRDTTARLDDDTYQIEQLTAEIAVAKELLLKLDVFREESRTLSDSDQINELRSLYIELAVELQRLGVEHAADHPYVLEALARIRKVRELIAKEPDSSAQTILQAINPLHDSLTERVAENALEIRGIRARRELLEQSLARYREQLNTIPARSMKLTMLVQNLSVESAVYEGLLKVRVDMQVAESMMLSNLMIVDQPNLPTKRKFPSRKINWILGFFVASGMALMVALTWEYVARAKEEVDQNNLEC